MASFTAGQLGPRFGIGTNVSVYLRSQWTGGILSGAPSGAAVAGPVAVDTNGNATFTGLTAETEYIIYAGSPDRYTSFIVGAGGASAAARDVEIIQPLPAGTNSIGTVDTELPAAAALADALANPTAPEVGAALQAFNGATWDRLRDILASDLAAGLGVLAAGLVVKTNGTPNYGPVGAPFTISDAGNLTNGVAVGDYSYNGATWDRRRHPVIFKPFASTAITAGTGATIWTPAAGKKFRLMGWLISSSVAGQLIFGDNAVGTVIARSEALAAAAASKAENIGHGVLSAAANNVLKLDGPTGNVAGMVWGTEE